MMSIGPVTQPKINPSVQLPPAKPTSKPAGNPDSCDKENGIMEKLKSLFSKYEDEDSDDERKDSHKKGKKDNFNPVAYKHANENGKDNSNENSALNPKCDVKPDIIMKPIIEQPTAVVEPYNSVLSTHTLAAPQVSAPQQAKSSMTPTTI